MTRSEAGARDLADLGAAVARVSAFDAAAVERALRDARAEVVIDELTALPRDPSEMAAAAAGRPEAAARGRREPPSRRAGVRGAAVHPAGERLLPRAGQRAGRRVRGPGGRRQPARGRERADLRRAGGAGAERGGDRRRRPAVRVLLRAGHLVPPGRGVRRSGPQAGAPRSSATAGASGRGSTSRTRRSPPPTPSRPRPACTTSSMTTRRPVAVWLPAFARFVGAPPPPRITEEQARASAGEDAVYYGTKLRGASNAEGEGGVRLRAPSAGMAGPVRSG